MKPEKNEETETETEEEKTFSQEDVDRIVARRLRKATKENEALADRLDKIEAANKQREEDRADEEETDDPPEAKGSSKELKAMERRFARLEEQMKATAAERDEAKALADKAGVEKIDYIKREQLSSYLSRNGVLAEALPDAVSDLMRSTEFEPDDNGGSIIVRVGNVPYEGDDINKGVKKYLTEVKPFYAKASGGTGSGRPTGKTGITPPNFEEVSAEGLISSGLDL